MLSDKYRCIFIHLPKTAGESIETVLWGKPYNDEKTGHGLKEKHWSAKEYKKAYPKKFKKYFKFTVVRNPWDQYVSLMNYRCKQENRPDLFEDKFNKNLTKSDLILNQTFKNMCFIDNICQVDFVIKFERLQEDFDKLCGMTKIPQIILPHVNKSNHKHYTEYYNDYSRRMIAQKYKDVINRFGYKFGK